MTPEQKRKSHAIIHCTAAAAAGVGAGLAQVPLSDALVICPMQITMVISLGAVFHKKIEEAMAKSILATQIATMTGRGISQFLIGWLPGVGNVVNAISAASVTEAIGWAVASDFSRSRYGCELDDPE
ncbi:hypothetical protein C4588_01820 [Candidatus Parcubacteria bacterium]|nr:MAG: hypothetical protein C4588_01820 [Candidatus Parcubacteria bacterium]